MVLTLLVGIHEDDCIVNIMNKFSARSEHYKQQQLSRLTKIIRPNGRHNKQSKGIQRRKVLDLKTHGKDEPRDGDGKENLEQSHKGQEPRASIDKKPEITVPRVHLW